MSPKLGPEKPASHWLKKLAKLRAEQWKEFPISFDAALAQITTEHNSHHGTQEVKVRSNDGTIKKLVFTHEKAAEWRYKKDRFEHERLSLLKKSFAEKIEPIIKTEFKSFFETKHPIYTLVDILLRCIQNPEGSASLTGNPQGPELELCLTQKRGGFEVKAEYKFEGQKKECSAFISRKQFNSMKFYADLRHKIAGIQTWAELDEKTFNRIMQTR